MAFPSLHPAKPSLCISSRCFASPLLLGAVLCRAVAILCYAFAVPHEALPGHAEPSPCLAVPLQLYSVLCLAAAVRHWALPPLSFA